MGYLHGIKTHVKMVYIKRLKFVTPLKKKKKKNYFLVSWVNSPFSVTEVAPGKSGSLRLKLSLRITEILG